MGQNLATKTLKEANRRHTTQRDRRVRSFSLDMSRWAVSLERDLLGTLAANRGGTDAVRRAIDGILANALPEAAVLLQRGLGDLATWSWDTETMLFVRSVPIPVWIRRIVPVKSLFAVEAMGSDGANLMEFEPDASLDIDRAFQRILAGELTKTETLALIRELEFGSPTPEQLDAILSDSAWPDGLNAMERIVTVPRAEIGQLRAAIHAHLALPGPDQASAKDALAAEIGDLVGNVNFKAIRIARTEGTRVAEDALRKSWEDTGDLIEAIQTFTAGDDNVRKGDIKLITGAGNTANVDHTHFHKKIYRRISGGGFRALDGEPLPRFPFGPNCRCWSTPVLRADLTAGLPDENIGPEYQAALDRFEKERAA